MRKNEVPKSYIFRNCEKNTLNQKLSIVLQQIEVGKKNTDTLPPLHEFGAFRPSLKL